MIGLVFVSHSAQLAEGVLELARGMAGDEVRMAAAGGMDLPERPLGTDPGLILQAIETVDSGDGVLVLMDLGSAILSAEMAVDLLPPEQRARVLLCEAPMVEGAVAAAVQARIGSPLDQVAAEARGALAAKQEHLRPAEVPVPSVSPETSGAAFTRILDVTNPLGLHARPAARFVQTVGRFPETPVQVRNLTNGKGPVSGRSINAIATLGVAQGHRVEVAAAGAQAEAVLAALQALAEDRFGDADEAPAIEANPIGPALEGSPANVWVGLVGSRGLALGPARHLRARLPEIPTHAIDDPSAEWARLETALARTRQDLDRTAAVVVRRGDRQAAGIFEAHALFLEDPSLREPARESIFQQRRTAAEAWQRASEAAAEGYRTMEDAYLRARATDVLDVSRQVIGHLLGEGEGAPVLEGAGILVAEDLTPAITARLDPALVKGICTAAGSPTSHSAILARTFGIPAVVGLGKGILAVPEGQTLALDADRGWVIPEPDEETLRSFTAQIGERAAVEAAALAESAAPATTTDGRRVEIGANIGSLAEAQTAVSAGAEGIGLLRTEFLFLDRTTAPDEEEQFTAYRDIGEAMGGRPVIVRTLDIGGDKPLPYIDLGQEANPFLGWRAIRMCLDQPEFFKTQLRAILRAAALHPLRVMFPMVATLEELRAARSLLAEAHAEALAKGHAVPDRIETGIMVEVPSAALLAGILAPEVDFFSIGTNDLTQYTLAAERGNTRVAALGDPCHPAVLTLIRQVAESAHAHGKWVGICGELGADVDALPILLGLGIDELSMSAPAIPGTKRRLRSMALASARELAARALTLSTAAEVRQACSGSR